MTEENELSPEIQEYSNKHHIEEVLTLSVNEVLRTLPPDPFSALLSIIKEHSLPIFTINSMRIVNVICQEFKMIPALSISMSYKGTKRDIFNYRLPFTAALYEKLAQSNYEELIKVFDEQYEAKFTNYSIESIGQFDAALGEMASLSEINHALSNAISLSCIYSMSLMLDQSFPSFIKSSYADYIINEATIPNLCFNLFKTGKTMNSKVKFEHFILIINNQTKMEPDILYSLINKIYAAIRKFLTQGKAGENGLRLNPEGSFYPPTDALNDILKLIENIIAEVNEKDILSIGIDCNADNYYSDANKTYEMDGFKKPPDTNQLIDFYIKLITDHPLITYLESPIAESDVDGWEKIYDKFSEEKPNVNIYGKAKVAKVNKEDEKKVVHTEPLKNPKDVVITPNEPTNLQAKTEENHMRENEEEENDMNSNVSYHIGNLSSLTEMVSNINVMKEEGDVSVALWDNEHETNNSMIVDIGLGLRVDNIILNGITMKEEKLSKISKYITSIKELY